MTIADADIFGNESGLLSYQMTNKYITKHAANRYRATLIFIMVTEKYSNKIFLGFYAIVSRL